ncbi:hypothetical protein WAF17_13325 [Bernardetia sp. ABR2-2B]|uniref:hypothetical protein n=1 Tax=Bernardetia sp. ABR2-2B TaxID=3127472 RepID=UPI0030CF82B9
MKNLILLLLLFLQTSSLAFANGGPIDMSFFKKTGNIRLLQKADISLLKEDLRIKIISDTTFIEVTYVLKNNGNTQSVHYGFPVDMYNKDHFDSQGMLIDGYDRINYFEAFVNEKPKKYSFWKQENAYKANMYKDGSSTKNVPIHRFWHQINLSFEKGSVQELVIKYAVENRKEDGFGGFSVLPYATDRYFVYDLFPSSSWSDGIVQDFSVTLDLSNLKREKYTYEITGLENLKQNSAGIYRLNTKDFDLKERSFISVQYRNYDKVKGHYLPKRSGKREKVISIVSSSPNATYLIDDDLNTVWKGKEGDWILVQFPIRSQPNELDPKYPYPLNPRSVFIMNGDYSSEENFISSPKIKTLQIKANDFLLQTFNWRPNRKGFYSNFINLETPKWFYEIPNIFEVAQSPFEETFEQELRNIHRKAGYSTHIETIAIYITKSDSESKEVMISDLYFY